MADNYERTAIGVFVTFIAAAVISFAVLTVSMFGAASLMIPALLIFAWCVGYAMDKAGLI